MTDDRSALRYAHRLRKEAEAENKQLRVALGVILSDLQTMVTSWDHDPFVNRRTCIADANELIARLTPEVPHESN